MENPDQNNSDEIARSPDEEQRMLEEMEETIKRHERIVRDFNIIGTGMSGNVAEGFVYDSSSDEEEDQ